VEVGQLRLAVGPPLVVITAQVGIVGGDGTSEVSGRRGDADHPGTGGVHQQREEMSGQGVVPKMVDPKLHFVAVPGPGLGDAHHTGVVDQQIDSIETGGHRSGQGGHRFERGQVEGSNLDGGIGLL
jgi:hypothetical protein